MASKVVLQFFLQDGGAGILSHAPQIVVRWEGKELFFLFEEGR